MSGKFRFVITSEFAIELYGESKLDAFRKVMGDITEGKYCKQFERFVRVSKGKKVSKHG